MPKTDFIEKAPSSTTKIATYNILPSTHELQFYYHLKLRFSFGLPYFSESTNTQNGFIRMGFGIIHDVQIYQFLQFNMCGLNILQDVHEEHGDILTNCHGSNNLVKNFKMINYLRTFKMGKTASKWRSNAASYLSDSLHFDIYSHIHKSLLELFDFSSF